MNKKEQIDELDEDKPVFVSLREESKKDYGATSENKLALEQINTGAMLRIADAAEAMAKNYVQLQADCERYKRWYAEERDKVAKLGRSNSALSGQITKLKKKLNTQKQ